MTANEIENKFDWGESARIINSAPQVFHPGQVVSICGMLKIKSNKLADKYNSSVGEWVYTVEYLGGSDAEIPERYLEKFTD